MFRDLLAVDSRKPDINGEEWGEVDFPPDVEAARELTARWDAAEKVKAA
jgi:choline kinase